MPKRTLSELSNSRRRKVKPAAQLPPDALALQFSYEAQRIMQRVMMRFAREAMTLAGIRQDAFVGLGASWGELFIKYGEILLKEFGPLFARMLVGVDHFNKDQFDTMFKRVVNIPFTDKPAIAQKLDSLRQKNIDLAKKLAGDSMQRVKEILDDNSGEHANTLAKRIEQAVGTTASHARLLARDQTLKLNADLTKHRQTAAGITRYEWSTSNDDRVRPMHRALDGQEFDWAHPPVVSSDGRREPPGLDYQCRCVAVPVIDLDAL